MSVIRIPCPSQDLKSVADTLEANIDHLEAELSPDATVHFNMESVPGPADGTTSGRRLIVELRGQPSQPLRQPSSPRRQRPKTGPEAYDPIQYTIDSLQTFGFTHPHHGRYLMMPQEFRAILARETKAVATVIWEIMQQTIGWEDGPGTRREWAVLTFRHFVRARLLSKSQAQLGIKQALEKHYIERRQVGARRYEYRIRWKGAN